LYHFESIFYCERTLIAFIRTIYRYNCKKRHKFSSFFSKNATYCLDSQHIFAALKKIKPQKITYKKNAKNTYIIIINFFKIFTKMKNLHLTKKAIILMMLLFLASTKLFSQFANTGTDFYVAFGKNDTVSTVKNVMDNRNVELILRITASKNTSVRLSFTENSALDTTFTVAAGTIRDYKLSPDQGRAAYSGKSNSSGASATTSKKSIRVIATQPICLLALSAANTNMESTLISPVEDWGTEYYHFGLTPYSLVPDFIQNCNGYLVVAQENNTTVQHYNPLIAAPNYPYTTVLNAGEVYHYYHGQSSYGTLSNPQGTRITADKPIAFFQNGTRLDLSGRNNFTFEQYPPANQWGRRFILPTNEHGAMYARIYAKDVPTEITVTYSNGTSTKQIIDNISVGSRYKDVQINANNNSSSRAVWITSDRQVGVCAYHLPRNTSTDMSQPGAAWLPPIGQMTRNVLMSPLDFDGSVVYLGITHFAYIITPTINKRNTTISLNGGAPQLVEQLSPFTSAVVYEAPNVRNSFKWVADSIGGSEYSCGIFYFGWSYASISSPKVFLNTTALIDNPNGVIVLANGQGSYTNYFHASGSAAHDLELTFYINNIHCQEASHESLCNTNYNFRAEINIPISTDHTYPRWYFNDIEEETARGKTDWDTILSPNTYTIRMEVENALGLILERTTTITVSEAPTIDAISTSAFCLGNDLNATAPTVTGNGSTITGEGWQMETSAGSNTYNDVNLPYQLSFADNGKKLRYYATNMCGTTYTSAITVTVNENLTPNFTFGASLEYCQNATPVSLPTTSNNGVSGSWYPTAISTATLGTEIYTFTPDAGECVIGTGEVTVTVTVNENLTPDFTFGASLEYCQNATPVSLPTTSNNGVSGSWYPSDISTATLGTATYTFTPNAGECVTGTGEVTVTVTVNENLTPDFTFGTSLEYCRSEEHTSELQSTR
jgi:hypothetical protein